MKQLTNSGQTVTDTYDTDAWGANGSSSGSTVNPFRFGGQFAYFTDSDSGLLRLGVRYLDPANGRFTQKDPLPDSLVPYTYVANRPTAATDPRGLIPVPVLDEDQWRKAFEGGTKVGEAIKAREVAADELWEEGRSGGMTGGDEGPGGGEPPVVEPPTPPVVQPPTPPVVTPPTPTPSPPPPPASGPCAHLLKKCLRLCNTYVPFPSSLHAVCVRACYLVYLGCLGWTALAPLFTPAPVLRPTRD